MYTCKLFILTTYQILISILYGITFKNSFEAKIVISPIFVNSATGDVDSEMFKDIPPSLCKKGGALFRIGCDDEVRVHWKRFMVTSSSITKQINFFLYHRLQQMNWLSTWIHGCIHAERLGTRDLGYTVAFRPFWHSLTKIMALKWCFHENFRCHCLYKKGLPGLY